MVDGNKVKAGDRISAVNMFFGTADYGTVAATGDTYVIVQWDDVKQTDALSRKSPLWEHVSPVETGRGRQPLKSAT